MKTKNTNYLGFTFIKMFVIVLVSQNISVALDQDKYEELLQKFVFIDKAVKGIKINAFNYTELHNQLKKSSIDFNSIFESLKDFDPESLPNRESKIAFWINVYNLGTLKLIMDNFPVNSIRSPKINLFTYPWGKKFVNVNGKKYSLSYIEFGILLGKYKELKAHFAINCASISCPDLSNRAYRGRNLDKQLSQQAKSFFKDKDRGIRIDRKNKKVYISRIFKYDSKNFKDGKKVIIPFILPFIENKEDRDFLENEKYDLKYLPYNWELNGF